MSFIVACPFTHNDLVLLVSEDRSLHKLAYDFFGNIMNLTVPFTKGNTPSVDDVHAALLVACSNNKHVYTQLVFDLQATPKKSLWPDFNLPPVTPVSLLWLGAQKYVVKEGTKRKSPENNTNNSSEGSPAKKGRRKGAKNWKKEELTTMLEIVEEHTPCGAKQWDKVAVDLYNAGYKEGRRGDVCNKNLISYGRLQNSQELQRCFSTFNVQKTSKKRYLALSAWLVPALTTMTLTMTTTMTKFLLKTKKKKH